MLWLTSGRPLITVDIVEVYKKIIDNRNPAVGPYYYFIVDSVSASPTDLPVGPRVFVHPESMVFNIPGEAIGYPEDGEGPYESIRQLKENSEIFKALVKSNPKRAQKIFEERYLIPVDWGDFAAFPTTIDDEFHDIIHRILQHTLVGSFKNKHVSGIHYFDKERVKIRELISIDENGVFEAFINVYNPNTDQWIQKQALTSFFPMKLSYTGIVMECEHAYIRRVKLSETKSVGISASGIMIVFIFRDCQLQTVYPVCNES